MFYVIKIFSLFLFLIVLRWHFALSISCQMAGVRNQITLRPTALNGCVMAIPKLIDLFSIVFVVLLAFSHVKACQIKSDDSSDCEIIR